MANKRWKHRLDGPAFTWGDYSEWWINGHHVTAKMIKWAKERDIDLNNLTDLDKAVIMMEWSNYNGD
jgi:hypothetical protein